MIMTRHRVHLALGWLWILDGALQLQPYMFTAGFGKRTISSAADGQPEWISAPAIFFAKHIAQHPAVYNTGFAALQLALGIGILMPRTLKPALAMSVGWSLGVWWFGEGLGGIASGHASLITGAPGAVVLYALLAVVTWPKTPGRVSSESSDEEATLARWFARTWAAVWVGGAILQLLPAQRSAPRLSDALRANADGAPRWIRIADRLGANTIAHAGQAGVIALAIAMAAIGLSGLSAGRWRTLSASAGAVLATIYWVVGQDLGQLYSGSSTDPNTGPLLILMAAGLMIGARYGPRTSRGRSPARHRRARPARGVLPVVAR